MTLRIRASAWSRVLARFGTPKRPRTFDEPLWLGAAPHWCPIELWVPADWTYLALCMKSDCVHWWSREGPHPQDIAVVGTSYPNDPRVAAILQPLHGHAAASVYVGDMDPISIVRYVETRRALRQANRRPLLYGGVDDAWLVSMERALVPRVRFANLRIALSKEERALLTDIERAIDLETIIGPRGCAMLRSGYKIELEGATNPGLYPPSHRRWVFRHLRALCERAANAPSMRRTRAGRPVSRTPAAADGR